VNTHLHVTAWILALILFVVLIVLQNQQKEKGTKVIQMILRLIYLVILYSGGSLLGHYFSSDMVVAAVIKSIAGIWVIAAMEMIVARRSKNEATKSLWIQWTIAFLLTIGLGFGYLPGGFLP